MKSKFMRAAIKLSIYMMRCGQGGPFGAVVVRGDKIIGRGCLSGSGWKDYGRIGAVCVIPLPAGLR